MLVQWKSIMAGKGESGHKLHARMRLWEFPDEYVVEPTDGTGGSFLSVSRVDGSMKLLDELPHCSAVRVPKIRTIYGVIGVLKLLAGQYLFVITECQCVGSYLGHPIYKVSSMKILPCDHSLKRSPEEQKRTEAEFSSLLNAAEGTPGLFFSYNANLTLSMQRLHDLGDESKTIPLWRQADPRYLWNNYMMEVLIDNKLDQYLLPILQGSFHHFQAAIGKDIIDVTLIARRCNRRTGTRMWRRGADPDGYVANFVETEQIMQLNGYTASFVQVRGSMPFLWEQIVNLKYKPNFEIVKPEEAPGVADRHFLDLRKRYGAVVAVDLVNKHGGEGQLCEMYGNAMQSIVNEDIRYLHFDFHRICGHIHFERLSMLYDQISEFLSKNRYLLLNEKGEKLEEQTGVVRTNCIDCLDRTNVTQSMIGRKILESQLRRIGIFGAEETISAHPNFDDNFKILWANHGDDVSIQYSGTPALKGDFVRCGKRTIEGILKDGFNALARYYLNNFCDGTRQDAIDLVHGNFIASVSRDTSNQLQKGSLETLASLPIALSLVLAAFFFSILSLKQVRHSWWNLFFSLMWASVTVAIAAFVRANGRMFCNRPRLHKPRR
ncbi:phosphoinositide phosphatase SAC6-like isoform X3 [Amaranthus tricolor]|uniref:phosphoinositide phosphatase SAC6-like isoform X3 n=1 Tax=Amaranthus tricolor TaxID=29722 RepID=UPI002587DAAD|nr:phosphoinositide phosphatase SAC6-like isoform X3 [Amaranthus tricolor]